MSNIIKFENNIFNDMSLAWKKGRHIAIIGPSGSGKTALVKSLLEVPVITKNDDIFSSFKKSKNMSDLLSLFDIEKTNNFTKEEKILIEIARALINKPELIAIDDLFIYLSTNTKEKLMNYLNKNGITLILTTSDIEDTLYTSYIYVIDKGKIIIKGNKDRIYKREKILNEIGYGLPFIVDLSVGLGYYELLDKVYLTKEDLAGALWK